MMLRVCIKMYVVNTKTARRAFAKKPTARAVVDESMFWYDLFRMSA